MKTIKRYIKESQQFLINKKLKNRQKNYEYQPKDKYDLVNIIIRLLDQDITNLNCIDVSEIEEMDNLFVYVNEKIRVKNINISDWDVSNVISMKCMFRNCSFFNADLSHWNVSKVTNMQEMFVGCEVFDSDLSNWDVSNVVNMSGMFAWCEKINFDFSNWDISNVKDKKGMFICCTSLTKKPKWYEL